MQRPNNKTRGMGQYVLRHEERMSQNRDGPACLQHGLKESVATCGIK